MPMKNYIFFKNSERQRLENIRRNQEAMQMFNLPEAVSAVSRSSDRNKRPAPTVGVKREKRTKTTEVLPRRTSNRIAKIAVRKRKDKESNSPFSPGSISSWSAYLSSS